ncbi:hypothetical protein ACFQ4Q_21610 [Lysobacter gummosus]|uniref:hypothetical protein n=1 Tax=Lysobacter gummosus TaxID=262324 RepID=UPI00363F3162
MRFGVVFLALLLSTGCDRIDKEISHMAGFGEQTVVLSSQPFELTSQGRIFTSKEQMKVLGVSSVCVVLKTHQPMAPQSEMDRDFESLLKGEKISATLTDGNGREHSLDGVGQAWSRHGAVSSVEEISACLSCACGSRIPDGTVIKSVQIKSDKPLPVLGAYWESMPKIEGPNG